MDNLIGEIITQITGLFTHALDIVDSLTTTEEEKLKLRNELIKIQGDITGKIIEYEKQIVDAQARVIQAEATGHSWLQRNWRPITMLVFVFIVFYNFIFAPITGLKALPTPEQLWSLMKLGITGYILGRSGEKIASIWRKDDKRD